MGEKKNSKAGYQIDYLCDNCGIANLAPDPSVHFNYVSPIQYKCPNCAFTYSKILTYPYNDFT